MFYHKIKIVVKDRGFTAVMSIFLYMRMGMIICKITLYLNVISSLLKIRNVEKQIMDGIMAGGVKS